MYGANALNLIGFENSALYFFDCSHIDFARLIVITQMRAFFVTRTKRNMKFKRRYSHPVDRVSISSRYDNTDALTKLYVKTFYSTVLRRVVGRGRETGGRAVFLTHNFSFSTDKLTTYYRPRWQVESLVEWIEQHQPIRRLSGHGANAVKARIWIAAATYVLTAILNDHAMLPHGVYSTLYISSLNVVKITQIHQLLKRPTENHSKQNVSVLLSHLLKKLGYSR